MRVMTSLCLLAALGPALAGKPAINYCHDPTVAADWERLLTKYEGDPDFQHLYTLRQDLCAEVDAGELSLNNAIERFEAARERVIEQRRKRLEELHSLPSGMG